MGDRIDHRYVRPTAQTSSDLTSQADTRVRISHPSRRDNSVTRSSNASWSCDNTTDSQISSTTPAIKRQKANKSLRQQRVSNTSTTETTSSTRTKKTSASPGRDRAAPTTSTPPLQDTQLTRSKTAPTYRRAPASHSSYGVETASGPPPSYETQRGHSQEKVWKIDRSKSLRMTVAAINDSIVNENTQDSIFPTAKDVDSTNSACLTVDTSNQSTPDTAASESVVTPTDVAAETMMTTEKQAGLGVTTHEDGGGKDSDHSEDVFMQLSREPRTVNPPAGKHQTRMSISSLPPKRPYTGSRLLPRSADTMSSLTVPQYGATSHSRMYASLGGHRAVEPSLHGQEAAAIHGRRPSSASMGAHHQRSPANRSETIKAVPQRSATVIRDTRLASTKNSAERPATVEQVATESSISTTAPSTVWDELEELKSRIKKLELTGKMPQSSAAAMNTAERPRTATTAATTMSSSPAHAPVEPASAFSGIPGTFHPLLHEAMNGCSQVLEVPIFDNLEAAAQDALQLALLMSDDQASNRASQPLYTEKQLKKRVEGVCRNLTELSIALSAQARLARTQAVSAFVDRPGSSEHKTTPSTILRSRRQSTNTDRPFNPATAERVQVRLGSRRASAQNSYITTRRASPERLSPVTAMALPQNYNSQPRLARSAVASRLRRGPAYYDGVTDENVSSPVLRPASRAMTDVHLVRRSSRQMCAESLPPLSAENESSGTIRTPIVPAYLSTNFITKRRNASPVSAVLERSPLAQRQYNVQNYDTQSELLGSARSDRFSTRRSLGLSNLMPRVVTPTGPLKPVLKPERITSRNYDERKQESSSSEGSLNDSKRVS